MTETSDDLSGIKLLACAVTLLLGVFYIKNQKEIDATLKWIESIDWHRVFLILIIALIKP